MRNAINLSFSAHLKRLQRTKYKANGISRKRGRPSKAGEEEGNSKGSIDEGVIPTTRSRQAKEREEEGEGDAAGRYGLVAGSDQCCKVEHLHTHQPELPRPAKKPKLSIKDFDDFNEW